MIKDTSVEYRVFTVFNYIFFVLFAFLTLYPFWYVLVGSLVPFSYYSTHTMLLWPGELSFVGYKTIFSSPTIPNAYKITIFITVVGTSMSMVITCLAAYVASEKSLPGKNLLMSLIIFTMLFNGGLIPTYLIYRSLGLIDRVWVYIAPHLITTFYMLIVKTNFQGVPQDLKDAAIIDGCNDFGIYARVMLPLAKPALTTVAIFTFIGAWNDFMGPLLYFNSSENYTVSIGLAMFRSVMRTRWDLLMAASAAMTVPMIIVFFAAQRYFVQGIVLTGLKG